MPMKIMMALNAYANGGSKHLGKWWLWRPMKMVDLNAYENGGSECWWEWWLWTPMKMVALNAYGSGGSKRLCKWWWLWTPMRIMMALNTYGSGDGSECQTVEGERWLWTSQLWRDGSERQTLERWWLWTPKMWIERVVLNAKLKIWWWLWTPSYGEMMRGKNAPVWSVVTNLDPLKGSKKDSMSLKRCFVAE